MNQAQFLGIVRHVLTAAGGIAVALGYTTDSSASALTGAVLTMAGLAWSMWAKRSAE